MPRLAIGSGNPSVSSFTMILDALTTATVSLVGTTKALYSVAGIDYVITGTGLTVSAGALTGGTITGISSSIGGVALHSLTKMTLAVSDVIAAIDAENTGDPTALDSLLLGQDWIISGTAAGNTSLANQLFGDNIWYGGGGNDSFEGGIGEDNLFGGAGNDFLGGNASKDVLNGDTGDDVAYGDAGNDILNGDQGADTLYGGDGNDTVYGGASSGPTADTSSNTLHGDDGNDLVSDGNGAGWMWGDDGADKLNGFGGNDYMNGGEGNDVLKGGGGHDTVYGGNGSDVITDAGGNDLLYGGASNDTITGGLGADTMTGAGGKDVFIFKAGDSGLLTAADAIADFETGSDKINLKGMGLTFIDQAAFTSGGTDPEIRWNVDDQRLELDLDGDDTADAHIVLQNGATLVASDLIL